MNETEKRLLEIEQREANASPGPWEYDDDDGYGRTRINTGNKDSSIEMIGDNAYACEFDPNFISHSREDVPWLLGLLKKICFAVDMSANGYYDRESMQTIREILGKNQ